MHDIDFDELDKAVNSVTNPKMDEPKAASDTDSVGVKVTPPAAKREEPSTSAAQRSPERSQGRFMDMVHPASDMRSKAGGVPERPERDRSQVPERSSTPERSEEPAGPDRSFEWPDPIDMKGTHSEANEEKVEEPAPKPLESPFLNDTKVEKRPLGAFSDAVPAADTSLLVDEEPEEKKEAPKEESDAKAEALATEALIQEAKAEEAPAEKPVDEAPVGPTSITQQYKEQPSTTDQPSGAVFDTEEYHKPLAHPPKKRSSVSIILWIIALILIGGGIGAAIYFFVLPLF